MNTDECESQAKSLRLLTVAVLLISACGSAKCPTPVQVAESTVLLQLRDAEQAKFAHERVVSNGQTVVCGLVNAKRPSGEYTGWRRFYVSGDPPLARIDLGHGTTRTALNSAEVPTGVTYESLWAASGCRNSDDEPGPVTRITSMFG